MSLFFRPQTKHKLKFRNDKEKNLRYSVYQENCKKIDAHNAKFKAGKVSYKVDLNEFSTLNENERKTRNGLKVPAK
jgi:hypothetical protein